MSFIFISKSELVYSLYIPPKLVTPIRIRVSKNKPSQVKLQLSKVLPLKKMRDLKSERETEKSNGRHNLLLVPKITSISIETNCNGGLRLTTDHDFMVHQKKKMK